MNKKKGLNKQMIHEERIYEKLYGRTKDGRIKEWEIKVEDRRDYSIMILKYGYVGGKMTEYNKTINEGKNKGKRNETTHYEQMKMEAEARWKKKKEIEGYTTNTDENKGVISSMVLPMLAQDYKKNEKKVKFPCYIQPKLDGYRMIYDYKNKKVQSRTGKEFNIIKETKLYNELVKANLNVYLDGELYVHEKEYDFEKYGVLRKQKKLTEDEKRNLEKIEYHVYDIISDGTFEERLKELKKLEKIDKIRIVETMECNKREDIDKYHKKFKQENYEGSIIRNKDGKYTCKYRSYDLLKYKDFDDNEFRIIDYTYENESNENGKCVIWICETKEGKKFNVQSKGTREERNKLYEEGDKYINNKLWVTHFGYTNDGIPRFPKTARSGREAIRNDII